MPYSSESRKRQHAPTESGGSTAAGFDSYMSQRAKTPRKVEAAVLMAARRRCCLCVFLHGRADVRKGQLAHLNRNPRDYRFENLVWLCFDHHDEYDARPSQAKGLMQSELRQYRDRLYDRYRDWPQSEPPSKLPADQSPSRDLFAKFRRDRDLAATPWRFPLWQTANEPELFAYKATNGADGICLIERVDLPDGRIVVAAIAVSGNPGNSITNCVESLCFQVCERFKIPASRLVWLEHYDYYGGEWNMVTFAKSPTRRFAEPTWTVMTPSLWKELRLRPKKRLLRKDNDYQSKLVKLFPWPSEALGEIEDI